MRPGYISPPSRWPWSDGRRWLRPGTGLAPLGPGPGWAKDPAIGARLINARAETAAEKPAFRAAMGARRCLVVADGFYEWRRTGRAKQAYLFQLDGGRPFAFAGLWETWRRPDNSPLETCTLLTTDANELVRPIHDRMPAILPPAAYQAWLDAAVENPSNVALLRPTRAARCKPRPSAISSTAQPTTRRVHRGGVAASGTGIKFGCSARVWSSEGEGCSVVAFLRA